MKLFSNISINNDTINFEYKDSQYKVEYEYDYLDQDLYLLNYYKVLNDDTLELTTLDITIQELDQLYRQIYYLIDKLILEAKAEQYLDK